MAGGRTAILGLGRSGAAAAKLLARRGVPLVMIDRNPAIAVDHLPAGDVYLGEEDPAWLSGVDLVVASPGIASDNPLLACADRAGIPVIAELELASQSIEAPIVAVTGTNGKSTVTTMVGDIFAAAGLRVFVGGNLGTPLCDAVGEAYNVVVVEVSSFQLERCEEFHPHVAVYLNLTEDHMERYLSLAAYGEAKARLFRNQQARDWAILNHDDPNVWRIAPRMAGRIIGFSLIRPASSSVGDALWIENNEIVYRVGERAGTFAIENLGVAARHARLNAIAAAAAALAMNIEPEIIGDTIARFRGLPHRLEFVRERAGVTYIDDSKGTNVGAVVEALEAVRPPIILIAGGVDKGGDYAPLIAPLRRRVKLLILMGAAREVMYERLGKIVPTEVVNDLQAAVRLAAERARGGDTVLLSPACSSFDQFRNYAERGDLFKKLVRAL
jgi:UDP-N-acetylmuramoylalanine--D-glutamate ligase